MDSTIDMLHPTDALDLSKIRFQLIRLEDTIIFNIIERVQFPYNSRMYRPASEGGLRLSLSAPYNTTTSFLAYMLRETERVHARVRRYQAPDELPFFPDNLPGPILPPLNYPLLLHPNKININADILNAYIFNFLPSACGTRPRSANGTASEHTLEERDQAHENYGSCAVIDVACLQALSRRVHFGKFVAEAKFLQNPEKFTRLIRERDVEGLMREITDEKVEKKVLERLRKKAMSYGRDPALPVEEQEQGPLKVNADAVVALYKDWIIPLTKKVEIEYLLCRLDNHVPDARSSSCSLFLYMFTRLLLLFISLILIQYSC
ncbi:chorismate mutase [Kalaharituber pfeilii]|nr:chorismate mutase [Kalaharituber pfeilii]